VSQGIAWELRAKKEAVELTNYQGISAHFYISRAILTKRWEKPRQFTGLEDSPATREELHNPLKSSRGFADLSSNGGKRLAEHLYSLPHRV
jgi:hypothetical protein